MCFEEGCYKTTQNIRNDSPMNWPFTRQTYALCTIPYELRGKSKLLLEHTFYEGDYVRHKSSMVGIKN